ncbi:expressed unknown protein [Seminavis robusta]|uniref:Uncharacterized protein n=1 Tax=Seminavis robusta TaxID=568900 RepID=A0A9N8DEE0_9STRA|nr:expressed unknown protein [Seminavis robusta]|eukprot:Sro101_g051490.1 n/a (225) ;mRNA; f:26394-27150
MEAPKNHYNGGRDWHSCSMPSNAEPISTATEPRNELTLGWAHVASLAEVEHVAKSLTKDKDQVLSVHDVIVSCVTAAIARQMQEHQMKYELDSRGEERNVTIPKQFTVMMLNPGVGRTLLDKKNKIVPGGSLIAPVPSDSTITAAQRLELVRESFQEACPQTPVVAGMAALGSKCLPCDSSMLDQMAGHKPHAACLVCHSPKSVPQSGFTWVADKWKLCRSLVL